MRVFYRTKSNYDKKVLRGEKIRHEDLKKEYEDIKQKFIDYIDDNLSLFYHINNTITKLFEDYNNAKTLSEMIDINDEIEDRIKSIEWT